MKLDRPMSHYWDTILNLELMGLVFVRAHRGKNFSLYLGTLKDIVPWLFIFAMITLTLLGGPPYTLEIWRIYPHQYITSFVSMVIGLSKKNNNRFSAMPINQAHEQNKSFGVNSR